MNKIIPLVIVILSCASSQAGAQTNNATEPFGFGKALDAVGTALIGQVTNAGSTNATNMTAAPTTNNSPAPTILGTLEGYLTVNDTNCNIWQSNHFDIFQAAVFQNVNGVPGASAVGNVLGLEVPFYRWSSNTFGLHVESLTDFETVFGDVGWQAMGFGADYNIHQVQVSAGLDLNLGLNGPETLRAAPFIEFKKASTSLNGLSPLFRYEIPIDRKTKSGLFFVGLQLPF